MLLNGASRKYKAGEVRRLFASEYNATHNGWTGTTDTGYFTPGGNVGHVLPIRHFWSALEMELDVVLFPLFDAVTLETERKRIHEELNNKSPYKWEENKAQAHKYDMPLYAISILGSREQIAGYTSDVLADFHQKYYSLPITTIILTGDVNHAEARERLTQLTQGASTSREALVKPYTPGLQRGEARLIDPSYPDGTVLTTLSLRAARQNKGMNHVSQILFNALNHIYRDHMRSKFGFYGFWLSNNHTSDHDVVFDFSFKTSEREKIIPAVQSTFDFLAAPETRQMLVNTHGKTIDRSIMQLEVAQVTLESLAHHLAHRNSREFPLRTVQQNIANYAKVGVDEVLTALDTLLASPLFMQLNGAKDALDVLPAVDVVDAWRAAPSAPSGREEKREQMPSAAPR
jgi:hypothetical protein